MKSIYRLAMLLLAAVASLPLNAQNQNIVFRSKLAFPGQTVANVCGYAAGSREYALIGASKGLIIVDVTNPDVPVQITQVPGPDNFWKEIKTYSHYAYTTSEGGQGINIVDLNNLPTANVSSKFYMGDGTIAGTLNTIHALHIDVTKGFLYAFGSNLSQGGAVVFDLNPDPYNPVYVGKYDQLGYVHDGYVDNDTLYASHINIGLFAIVNMTNKANPVVLNTQNTPSNFTHNTWLSQDRKVIFTTDEVPDSYVAAYDISDPEDIKYLDKVRSNPGSGSIGHNTHILGNYAITAWYTDGVTIVDATIPGNLVQVGNYDTYPSGAGSGFDGCWGVYPFLPSGNFIAGNINPGEMYILTPTYVRAAYLKGTITDAQTGNPLSNAKVEFVGNTASAEFSSNVGAYAIGQTQTGQVQVKVTKLGYFPMTVSANILTGQVTTLNVALSAAPTITISGNVVQASNGTPVPNASVSIQSTEITFNTSADANGQFSIPGVFAGEYNIIAGAWGYQYGVLLTQDLNANQQFSIELTKGYQDDFVFDYGWTASGTSATGKWERGEPLGVNVGIDLAPDTDVSNDLGDQCFITGNSTGAVDEDDVESGTSILTSPPLDLSGYVDPRISAQIWCTSFNQFQQSFDSIKVYISNGLQEKLVWFKKGNILSWQALSFDVTDFLQLSSNMKLRVVCRDDPNGTIFDSYEANFDNFKVMEQVSVAEEPTAIILITAQPNPFSNSTVISYDGTEHNSLLQVYNVLGQLVETRLLSDNAGQVSIGAGLGKGVYFVRLEQGGTSIKTIKLLKVN